MLNLDGAAEAQTNFTEIRKQLIKKCLSIDGILKDMGKTSVSQADRVTFRDFNRVC
jgi:hypothetical protein